VADDIVVRLQAAGALGRIAHSAGQQARHETPISIVFAGYEIGEWWPQ